MSNFALHLPDSLYTYARNFVHGDDAELNQFIVSALAEKISAMDADAFFSEKAKGGDISQALAVLDKVAEGEIRSGDEIL